MSEVQDRSQIDLSFVAGHNFGLYRASSEDEPLDLSEFEEVDPREIVKHLSACNDGTLDNLRNPVDDLALGQAVEKIGIDQDGAWLVERAQLVFPSCAVDTGLSPDAAVHLGQERGGDLEVGDPSFVY